MADRSSVKLSSEEGKKLLELLKVQPGDEVKMPGLFPGLPVQSVARCTESSAKAWGFELRMFGLYLCSLKAEINGSVFELEVL